MSNATNGRRILVVDDDEAVRRTLRTVLARAGCSVVEADDGHGCIRELEAGFRGVILLDLMMPGLDGWSTVQAIVERGLVEGNLVCMLTACVDPKPAVPGLESHVFDYVVKPFDVEELVDVVELALGQLGS